MDTFGGLLGSSGGWKNQVKPGIGKPSELHRWKEQAEKGEADCPRSIS